ncbi:MAG TPA: hypothetical protein VKQ52_19855, partial [Puia sp.]|nr:hypothetical protein [Puia sp.]
ATVTATTASSKKITGTFSFSARVITIDTTSSGRIDYKVDTVAVTSGKFQNIPYSYIHRR